MPEEVDRAVKFLAIDASSCITGETLAVHGGRALAGMVDDLWGRHDMAGLVDRHAAPARFASAIDQLHEVVAQQTGASDFEPDDSLSRLHILLLSMDHDPRLIQTRRRIA